jgi:hypothetical protein
MRENVNVRVLQKNVNLRNTEYAEHDVSVKKRINWLRYIRCMTAYFLKLLKHINSTIALNIRISFLLDYYYQKQIPLMQIHWMSVPSNGRARRTSIVEMEPSAHGRATSRPILSRFTYFKLATCQIDNSHDAITWLGILFKLRKPRLSHDDRRDRAVHEKILFWE